MKIYILTRARPDRQITAGQLEEANISFIYAVTKSDDGGYPPGEREVFDVTGLSAKHQAVMDANPGRHVQLDDDMTFLTREGEGSGRTKKSSSGQMLDLFARIEYLLNDYQLVGLAERFMVNHRPYPYSYDCKQVHLFGIDGAWMKEKGIRFDRVILLQDIDFVMQVLAAGGRQVLITDHCHQDAPMWSSGGCSEYRTRESYRDGHVKLQKLWPGFVEIVERPNSLNSRVAWKRLKKHYAGLAGQE